MQSLITDRLILRPWKNEDLEFFAELNADPRVMEHFPSTLKREESDALGYKLKEYIEKNGWGLWAVSIKDGAPFIGFIGLSIPNFEAHFTPAVEVGWRLAFNYWGKGYASEGAHAAIQYGFEQINLKEIVSFTPTRNKRSIRVMEKLGMSRDEADDFDHPNLEEGHLLKRFVLYRLRSD